jgi:hypothetical protein
VGLADFVRVEFAEDAAHCLYIINSEMKRIHVELIIIECRGIHTLPVKIQQVEA